MRTFLKIFWLRFHISIIFKVRLKHREFEVLAELFSTVFCLHQILNAPSSTLKAGIAFVPLIYSLTAKIRHLTISP